MEDKYVYLGVTALSRTSKRTQVVGEEGYPQKMKDFVHRLCSIRPWNLATLATPTGYDTRYDKNIF